jgi:transcriptional regulator with XRE-family HTH domain
MDDRSIFDGGKLRRFRNGQFMSRAELSEISGYNVDQIGRWERGQNHPRMHTIRDLAYALGVKPQALLTDEAVEKWDDYRPN